MSKFKRNNEKPVQNLRFAVQATLILVCIWIAVEFYFFVGFLESGGLSAQYTKPGGAEGFLPISALMSFFYFIVSGNIHGAHPAGLFIFIAILVISLVFGKSFCSWMCPVGFISELVGDFGEKIQKKLFKRVIKIPKFFDYPLRSLKYLLLGFFAYSIFSMTQQALEMFLNSPYNQMADIKMWYFFFNISKFALIVISVLVGLSMIIRNFWCRYLCPYGAFLGIASLLSPHKIKRESSSCIDCNLCSKACPSKINVAKVKFVISDECSTCMSCVDACPVRDTLNLKNVYTKKVFPKKWLAIGIISIYIAIISFAMITNNWDSKITNEMYLKNFKNINSLGHPRSPKDIEKLNNKAKNQKIKIQE